MFLVVSSVLLAVGATTYLSVKSESKVLRQGIRTKGNFFAESLAASTKSSFWSLNWIFVETQLKDSYASSPDEIVYAKVVKPDGEVYLANKKNYYGEIVPEELLFEQQTILTDFRFTEEQDEGMLIVHPVNIGSEVWFVLVGLSHGPTLEALKSLIVRNISWGALLLVVTTVLAYFLAKSIIRPLSRLTSMAHSIAEGDRKTIEIRSGDEVGKLGHSFNTMVNSIELAEDALKASNEQFVTVLNSIDATIFVTDRMSGKVLFANRHMKEAFGDDFEQAVGFFRPPEDGAEVMENDTERLVDQTGAPVGAIVWETNHPDTGRWYMNSERKIQWIGNRMATIHVAADITRLKELEQKRLTAEAKLQRSQKMELVGRIASGVAHDLNNILSGIVGYPEILLMDMAADSPLRNPIERIQEAGQRAAAIVNDLLTLARRGVAINKVTNLNTIVEQYLCSPEQQELAITHPKVCITTHLEDNLLALVGSPVHLIKVVMNLVHNAAEAMPEGGSITVTTQNVYVDRPIGGYDHIDEGDYVLLEVRDNGIGIAPDDLPKIFEPFYSQKEMGDSGTGLGMTVIEGTVSDHKGFLDVRSAVGEGTTFSIYLPATHQIPEDKDVRTDLSALRGNGQTVLLVDDVEAQRELGGIILQRLGYKVKTVSSGEAAIQYLEGHDVDSLVLDMIMDPGIDGLETFKRVLAQKPGQKAILASGYSETERVKEAIRMGAFTYIKKPYTMEEIGKALFDMFHGESDEIMEESLSMV